MVVKELKSECGGATVSLSYKEITTLANLLFFKSEELREKGACDNEITELDVQFNVLQELDKGGGLQMLVSRYNIDRITNRGENSPEPHEGE